MPASTMKIVTMAAAGERLGWDYTYETRLVGAGTIDGGVLNGDLVVVGSGDPSIGEQNGMSARLFAGWADRIKAAGVHAISGRIVGDDRAFDDQPLGFGWSWDDLAEGFATSTGALQYNENTVDVTIRPGAQAGMPAAVSRAPGGAACWSTTGSGRQRPASRRRSRSAAWRAARDSSFEDRCRSAPHQACARSRSTTRRSFS